MKSVPALIASSLIAPCLAQDAFWPKCLLCVSASRILSPGFGIDITTSYATSAVRYHNGTISRLSKVDASSFGREIKRLDEWYPRTHNFQKPLSLEPPSNAIKTRLIELTAQVLADLKVATLAEHGLQLNPVLLSFLPLHDPSIGYDIMHEAADLAGMKLLLDGFADVRPGSVANAAAANGLGLCSTFIELDVCELEELQLPQSLVFGVEYTAHSLTVALSPFQASRNGHSYEFRRHWNLGFQQAKRDRSYWHQVKSALSELPIKLRGRRITDIIVTGEAGMDEPFFRTLQETLWEVLHPRSAEAPKQPPLTEWTADPEFAAAMGAAEYAKRIMESPDGCIERVYCDWWRRAIG